MKRFSLLSEIKNRSGLKYLLVAIAISAIATAIWRPFILFFPLLFWIFYRLFTGKLRVRDGDVILFWGLPDSGKTMFLTKTAYDNCVHPKDRRHLLVCSELDHIVFPHRLFHNTYWGYFKPPEHSAIFIDEASLNGWDSREWHTNFDEKSLEAWKKIRHDHTCAVMSNQGFSELDCKIRDSLTRTLYYVENKGFYSRAIRMDKNVKFSEINGLPLEGYKQPTFIQRLRDPSCVLYAVHKKYGKFYNTFHPMDRPSLDDVDLYEPVYDRKGKFKGYRRRQTTVPVSPSVVINLGDSSN